VLAGRIIDSQGLGATIRADMTSIPGTLKRSMINPISPDILTFRYCSALGTFADRNLGGSRVRRLRLVRNLRLSDD
jgi:hypothetical protein